LKIEDIKNQIYQPLRGERVEIIEKLSSAIRSVAATAGCPPY
jgi:hypothetical protein